MYAIRSYYGSLLRAMSGQSDFYSHISLNLLAFCFKTAAYPGPIRGYHLY